MRLAAITVVELAQDITGALVTAHGVPRVFDALRLSRKERFFAGGGTSAPTESVESVRGVVSRAFESVVRIKKTSSRTFFQTNRAEPRVRRHPPSSPRPLVLLVRRPTSRGPSPGGVIPRLVRFLHPLREFLPRVAVRSSRDFFTHVEYGTPAALLAARSLRY